eukprot:CAMPEP_0174717550 /NCGR_PEP_ID=MMETSP1094-20130205/26539_1 /TAXON_ID=156173 /ORGANISM="Chrysochromulina brevifilum, Strain UTEX LB 985" /LENGTH=151 /DNA_ID=CAMNT_0015917497 /DNA_START=147 /DNA_END=600 /DNA_ORIENTATION=-
MQICVSWLFALTSSSHMYHSGVGEATLAQREKKFHDRRHGDLPVFRPPSLAAARGVWDGGIRPSKLAPLLLVVALRNGARLVSVGIKVGGGKVEVVVPEVVGAPLVVDEVEQRTRRVQMCDESAVVGRHLYSWRHSRRYVGSLGRSAAASG